MNTMRQNNKFIWQLSAIYTDTQNAFSIERIAATFSRMLFASVNSTFFQNRRYLSEITENEAPVSTRARACFLSIITSSWLPVCCQMRIFITCGLISLGGHLV
ncbi:hypothetical protein TNCT_382261 [Trichonephila clavata]|uniref:Uncharacterized protein n=1 Tax=Trichonephila clavata TaxID=2740835 RepID=A0A8X6L6J0_TRICU|nr:hypothetical protein TNCT_382261 [Trichonephila clavata]